MGNMAGRGTGIDVAKSGVESLSFEKAMAELDRITTLLESGSVNLDDAIRYYERACLLQEYCSKKLRDAQMKVTNIKTSNSGGRGSKDEVVEKRAVASTGGAGVGVTTNADVSVEGGS